MTELQYLLLSDSIYINLDSSALYLSSAIKNGEYSKENRKKRILNFSTDADLEKMEVVATRNLSNGLYCMAVKHGTELVFAYRGTEPETWQDMTTNIDLWAGPNVPSQFINAVEFYNDICSDDKYSSLKFL